MNCVKNAARGGLVSVYITNLLVLCLIINGIRRYRSIGRFFIE